MKLIVFSERIVEEEAERGLDLIVLRVMKFNDVKSSRKFAKVVLNGS